MRAPLKPIGAALTGAALCVSGTAFAAPIDPTALLPALDVYVDSVVAGHAAAATCAGPKSPASDEAGWSQGKAVFIATLWANGFPINFVRTASQRLDAAPPAGAKPPDCSDPALLGELGVPSQEGWLLAMQQPLSGMELSIITDPVTPTAWADIRTKIGAELPVEKRLLDCVAVSEPGILPFLVHDWDQMLGQIRQRLTESGLPRDEVSAALSAGEANTLWHRAAPAGEAELRDSCAKDKDWRDRLGQMSFGRLKDIVDKLLPAAAAGK